MRLAILLTALTLPAHASTEAAWDEMRERLAQGCEALLPEGGGAVIDVNPFGSESYGLALVMLTDSQGATERMAMHHGQGQRRAGADRALCRPALSPRVAGA